METWRPIPGWEGIYEASNEGRVRSLDRALANARGVVQRRRGRVLRLSANSDGYLTVTLQRGRGVRRTYSVSNLIAAAFIGPRPDGLVVCHNNGDQDNNSPSNLRYDTVTENNRDRLRHGTNPQRAKTHCPRGHAYDDANTYFYKGWRQCRTCRATHAQKCSAEARRVRTERTTS